MQLPELGEPGWSTVRKVKIFGVTAGTVLACQALAVERNSKPFQENVSPRINLTYRVVNNFNT